jgi:hypothetical protein
MQEMPQKMLESLQPEEREYNLEPFETVADEFDDKIIQFGYTTLFIVALPIVPLFALVDNMIGTALFTESLYKLKRRSFPKSAENVGYACLKVLVMFMNVNECV